MKKKIVLIVIVLFSVVRDINALSAGDSTRVNSDCPFAKYQKLADEEFRGHLATNSQVKKKFTRRRNYFSFSKPGKTRNRFSKLRPVREGRLSRCFVR